MYVSHGCGVISGCHVFAFSWYTCQNCRHNQRQGMEELLEVGGFPADPKNLRTFIDESVLATWDNLSKQSPMTSLSAYLKCVQAEGGAHANEVKKFCY